MNKKLLGLLRKMAEASKLKHTKENVTAILDLQLQYEKTVENWRKMPVNDKGVSSGFFFAMN